MHNHPGIVIWQPENHPWYANIETTLDWYDKIFETILSVDYSRLISHAELSYYVYGSILQETVATSDNVDVVYGPDDEINPVIFNIGERKTVNLSVNIRQPDGSLLF